MPVSKNKRKSKKGQSRKVNRAKAGGDFGGGEVPDTFDLTPPTTPATAIPGQRPVGMNIDTSRRYKVINPPDDPELSEMEQIDAIIRRSVTFEMTEAHYATVGLREIDLGGEFEGGDILGPMVAKVDVDPLATMEGHSEWTTGQELIDYLDADPNVFRGEFDGNRWQGSGVPWTECPPSINKCFDRIGINDCENPPHCPQCDTEVNPEEIHFHILDEDGLLRLCERCWSKGPLPEGDRTLELDFQEMIAKV